MSLLVAFDISTKALTGCVVPLDAPKPGERGWPLFFELEMPHFKANEASPQHKSIERCARAGRWYHDVKFYLLDYDISCVAVEEPFGAYKGNELREIYGALIASVPAWMITQAMTAQQWRRKLWAAIGSKADVTKAGGRRALEILDCEGYAMPEDEHRLDALGLALAVRMQWWEDQGVAG